MTPEFWQRLKELYEAALDTPATERARFVAEACGDDLPLKDELEELLDATTADDSYLEKPLFNLSELMPKERELLPEGQLLMGKYQIVRHIGSGGMGEVYEARDLDLQMGRIALKVIRPSIAENPAILARFKKRSRARTQSIRT